jgi:hypothetical protein
VSGTTALSMNGRLNLNGPLSGTLTMKVGTGTPSAKTIEQVLTAGGFYMRQADGTAVPSGPWQKVDPARAAGGLPNLSLGKYAEILALQDGADKGTETVAGVRAHRLSGRVGIEQVRTLEPGLYDRLRAESLDGFQCDTWVDEAGRVVKLEQWLKVQGTKAHNTFTLGSFGPVLSVAAPTAS